MTVRAAKTRSALFPSTSSFPSPGAWYFPRKLGGKDGGYGGYDLVDHRAKFDDFDLALELPLARPGDRVHMSHEVLCVP